MMTLIHAAPASPAILQDLGLRFRDYRMRLRMTRKEVAEVAGVGMTTLYRFESGLMTDISFRTLVRLMRVIGMAANWDQLIPALPEDPYLYRDDYSKIQRIRHPRSK